MKPAFIVISAALAVTLGPALGQHPQPYAGFQSRSIKALSDQQISDLRAGRGMGLALAAELNGYPGPAHVLELATELGLTDAQRAHVQNLFNAMTAETIPLGERVVAQETELDHQFASKTATPASLVASTNDIGAAQATLRATHLKYHLLMLEVLTPPQLRRYAELRGYANVPPAGAHDHHPN
jgi:Spy/CpxP family protein refolding chaperone